MSKMKKGLPQNYMPSAAEVERCLDIWNKNEWSLHSENGLKRLFEKVYPANDNLEGVIIKCAALNQIYSTNIFDINSMAMHIYKLKIDDRLNQADLTLVDDIANIEIGGKHRRFYSFATKYCSHHRPESYPIYDSYVQKVLCCMLNDVKAQEMRDYEVFVKAIKDFKERYGLQHYTLKQIDHYLWQLGKEYYDPNAKERK